MGLACHKHRWTAPLPEIMGAYQKIGEPRRTLPMVAREKGVELDATWRVQQTTQFRRGAAIPVWQCTNGSQQTRVRSASAGANANAQLPTM